MFLFFLPKKKKNVSVLGFEPRISCSVGRRLIHWAIRTMLFSKTFLIFKLIYFRSGYVAYMYRAKPNIMMTMTS